MTVDIEAKLLMNNLLGSESDILLSLYKSNLEANLSWMLYRCMLIIDDLLVVFCRLSNYFFKKYYPLILIVSSL